MSERIKERWAAGAGPPPRANFGAAGIESHT